MHVEQPAQTRTTRLRRMDAFAAIVQRFQKMAAGYAFAVLGDFHLAEDAAQMAFFEAYGNLTKVYDAVAFPAWLRKIVFKQCDRIARKGQAEEQAFAARHRQQIDDLYHELDRIVRQDRLADR